MNRKTCTEPNCGGAHYARGLCNPHYQSWKRANSHLKLSGFSYVERFWVKVNKEGPIPDYCPELGPCWLWTGALNKRTGYGNFGKPQKLPHRVAYELCVGPIPEGLELDHLCRIRHCVNPTHLEPVTTQVNQLRSTSVSARNAVKTHCDNGHLFDEKNTLISRGRRTCRACNRDKTQRHRAKKAA